MAAQEALQVFVERGAGADVLLVSPEWIDCSRWLPSPAPKLAEVEKTGVVSRLVHGFHDLLSYPLSVALPSRSPEIVIGPKVQEIDVASRTAVLDNGSQITFDRCLIAVGSSLPDIPIGRVISKEAAALVSGAQTQTDWQAIDAVIQDGEAFTTDADAGRAHVTVVGGGWMSTAVGAALIDRGADVTFSHSEPAFLARYFPKYLGQELFSRFLWQSAGGVDTLSYSALRYIIARTPVEPSFRPIEAEVHVGTVFDAFSIVDFRTDHVIFAPTLPPRIPLDIPTAMQKGGLVVNPELAVASDVYAAGASIGVGSGAIDYPEVMRWSADHARATGRHAARNILGAREAYAYRPSLTVDLDSLCLRLHIIGDVDGSVETFGYFIRSRDRDEDTAGGQLEIGALFCVKPAPPSHRGATQRLFITGVALWEGSRAASIEDIDRAKCEAEKLVRRAPVTRPELEVLMDKFATSELGISLFVDTPQPKKTSVPATVELEDESTQGSPHEVLKPLVDVRKPSPRVIWRRHRSARTTPIRKEELLWIENEWMGAISPDSSGDKLSGAYTELLQRAAAKD